MEAILPMEFLIPTLRVAQQLEWNGREFSNKLDKLERLDETKLIVVVSMYALKQRQKGLHHARIKTKDFQICDLVLEYTLKQDTSRLKNQGMEPYVIHDISTSGALCLATINNKKMPNCINGFGVKNILNH